MFLDAFVCFTRASPSLKEGAFAESVIAENLAIRLLLFVYKRTLKYEPRIGLLRKYEVLRYTLMGVFVFHDENEMCGGGGNPVIIKYVWGLQKGYNLPGFLLKVRPDLIVSLA